MQHMQEVQKLEAADPNRVTLKDGLWAPRQETNHRVTLRRLLEHIYETGRVDNFLKAAGKKSGTFEGRLYNDSDVYKWIEAAARAYMREPDQELKLEMDKVVEAVAAAQHENGYLNTYFTLVEPNLRWTNLNFMHELFCAGHLIQAAVAMDRATGDARLLEVARRFADHIYSRFGPGKRNGYPGHPEIELALVELYRYTGERRYLDLAAFFVDARGGQDSPFAREFANAQERTGTIAGNKVDSYPDFWAHTRALFLTEDGSYDGSYAQDHAPVREQNSAEGHAVRALYLYCGMADVAAETEDAKLLQALEAIWRDLVGTKMYVTGGVGSSHENEGFTRSFDLPSLDAYSETCASVGMIMWNYRMWMLTRDGAYMETVERVLYNAFLAGVSTDGERFFYVNPLESVGNHHRQPWFNCACCPPNASRLVASLGEYLYSTAERELFVNLYVASHAQLPLTDTTFEIVQEHDYPWDGTITLAVTPERSCEATIWLRIPDWCDTYTLTVDGEPIDAPATRGYVPIHRVWRGTASVQLLLPLGQRFLHADPRVRENRGKTAIARGPLVYCLESADNDFDLTSLRVDVSTTPSHYRLSDNGLPSGTVVLEGSGVITPKNGTELYEPLTPDEAVPVRYRAIPYFEWDNREPGRMLVWATACTGTV